MTSPLLLASVHNEYVGVGSRFLTRVGWRWHVYQVGPFGDRLIGRTYRFRVAERWLGPWNQRPGVLS